MWGGLAHTYTNFAWGVDAPADRNSVRLNWRPSTRARTRITSTHLATHANTNKTLPSPLPHAGGPISGLAHLPGPRAYYRRRPSHLPNRGSRDRGLDVADDLDGVGVDDVPLGAGDRVGGEEGRDEADRVGAVLEELARIVQVDALRVSLSVVPAGLIPLPADSHGACNARRRDCSSVDTRCLNGAAAADAQVLQQRSSGSSTRS